MSPKCLQPGFDKDDLDISIANNRLVIKAKTCKEEKEEKGDYLKQEIRQSEVYRSVFLHDEVDDEKIKTSYKRWCAGNDHTKTGKIST